MIANDVVTPRETASATTVVLDIPVLLGVLATCGCTVRGGACIVVDGAAVESPGVGLLLTAI